MKVAFVYDRINTWGGAERVLLALHELFPDAPLYTSVFHKGKATWAKQLSIVSSFLQKFPKSSDHHQWYPLVMPLAFESFSFDEYDIVISVTSEAAKGILVKPGTIHICYCLTPTRYLWSGYEEYFSNSIIKWIISPIVWYLRTWDKTAAKRPDVFIAISQEVRHRIKKYYKRESEVVYPPVEISFSKIAPSVQLEDKKLNPNKLDAKPYFLVVSRLIPYKRIDLAIEACNKLQMPLKIVGTGSEERKLKKIAGSTIEFLGSLTDMELMKYYMDCYGLIVPGNEDFGLTILEAQAFGKPVLAYKAGGACETIIQGKTGEFFYPQTVSALIDKLKKFQVKTFNKKDCRKQAERFSKELFKKQFLAIVEQIVKNKQIL